MKLAVFEARALVTNVYKLKNITASRCLAKYVTGSFAQKTILIVNFGLDSNIANIDLLT